MRKGDVLLGDRNYLRPAGVQAATQAKAYVLLRLRWTHSRMHDPVGRDFRALDQARTLKVGEIGEWPVSLLVPKSTPIEGRVVITKLPAPVAEKAQRRIARASNKKSKKTDPRTLEASHYVMLFTTVPVATLAAADVLELYRFRWQIELAFKRMKQLLRLGRLPHKDPHAAQTWILAKLVVALLLEKLFRNASAFSPWGFDFQALEPRQA